MVASRYGWVALGAFTLWMLGWAAACQNVAPPTFCEAGAACAEASAERCATGPEARAYGRSGYDGRTCVARDAEACRGSALACAHFGQCMVPQRPGPLPETCTGARVDADHRAANDPRCTGFATCVAGADADCRASGLCRLEGRCIAKDGVCAANSDADCMNSNHCSSIGWCHRVDTPEGPRCRATTDADCRASRVCQGPGQCAVAAGACVTCARSETCRRDGACSRDGERCVALSDEDCRRSEGCRNHKRCRASRGVCVTGG